MRLDATDNGWSISGVELSNALAAKILFNNAGTGGTFDTVTVTDLDSTSTFNLSAWAGNNLDTTASANASAVAASGDWFFANDTDLLTYYDVVAGAVAAITLTGVASVSVSGSVFSITGVDSTPPVPTP